MLFFKLNEKAKRSRQHAQLCYLYHNFSKQAIKHKSSPPPARTYCTESPLKIHSYNAVKQKISEKDAQKTFSRLNNLIKQSPGSLTNVQQHTHNIYNKKEERHLETSDTGHALQASQCAHALYQVGAAQPQRPWHRTLQGDKKEGREEAVRCHNKSLKAGNSLVC